MNRLLLCAVLSLAVLVCLSMADEGPSLRREVRKTKHTHKREDESAPEMPEDNPNDGYTVVTIPKSASRPALVDSIMSFINDANQLTTVQEVTSTPPANIDEATTTTSAPSEDSPTTTTTSEPIVVLNSNNAPEESPVLEVKEAPEIDEVTMTTSAASEDNPTTSTTSEPIIVVNSNDVTEGSPVAELKVDDVTGVDNLASNIIDDFDTSNLMPLVDKVSSLSFENSTNQDTPALASVCEESKRELVQMFNKVIGQLSELFNSMYEKMAAIATHQQETLPSN